MQTSLLIALLLNYDFSAATAWPQQKNRRGANVEGMSEKQITTMVEDYFFKADVEELALSTDPACCPLPHTVQKTAEVNVKGLR